jgi:hypothetical protein
MGIWQKSGGEILNDRRLGDTGIAEKPGFGVPKLCVSV